MLKTEERLLPQSQDQVKLLYQRYSALLLGYIFEIVPDQKKSEEYLVAILSRFAVDFKEELAKGKVTWVKLLCYSRNLLPQLKDFKQHLDRVEIQSAKNYSSFQLELLTNLEKEIFCEIYYHGKSISDLARKMQKSEDVIRSNFKLSFDKIRSTHGN